MTDKIGIKVGGIDKQEVEAVERAVLSILSAPAEQKTIRVALDVLARLTAPASISNVSFHNAHSDLSEHHHAVPPSPGPSDADEGDYD